MNVAIRFKSRILVPLTFVLVALVSAFVGGFFFERTQNVEQDFSGLVDNVQVALKNLSDDHAKQFVLAAQTIAANEHLLSQFLARDRAGLLRTFQPMFEELRDELGITHWYFHDKNHQNFLRLHDPTRHGDTITRETLRLAETTEKPAVGFELGPLGTLTLRAVIPWRNGNNIVGFIEVGQEIFGLLRELNEIFGTHFYVALDTSRLAKENWKQGMKMLGRQAEWPDDSTIVVIGQTVAGLPDGVRRILESHDSGKISNVELTSQTGKREYQVTVLPLPDIKGQQVGTLAVLRDVTAQTSDIYKMTQHIGVIAGAAAILLFAFFYELLIRSERGILVSQQAFAETLKLDLNSATDTAANNDQPSSDMSRKDSQYDPVTELPSFSLFQDRLTHGLASAQRESKALAVCFIEISNVDDLLDAFGESITDQLLKQIAWRLKEGLRKSDTVAKASHNEFVAILYGVNLDLAVAVVQKVLKILGPPIVIGGLSMEIRPIVGLALHPYHGSDGMALLRRAQTAKREAAKSRLAFSVFDTRPEDKKQRHVNLLTDLHEAIKNDQLELHYLPRVDLRSGHVNGTEALLRWRHHERGSVPPEEIVELAEKTGLIKVLTRWVLMRALRQQANWRKSDVHLQMAINVSELNVADPTFARQISEALQQWDLPPSGLTLEITEKAITNDPQRMIAALRELHNMGIQLAIDDVGTGNSSLPYLKSLPVSEIKIDESIIYTLPENSNNVAFVRSTIDLAQSLGITVCAEGVKNKAIWEILRQLNCNGAQGYHVNQPSTSGAFECWLTNSKYGLGKQDAVCTWREDQ